MYPGTSRTLVFLRRFVSSGPVAFSIPPQPGQGKIQVLGRLGAQHRVTKLLQIYQNSLPSRNQARQAGLLLSIEHQSRRSEEHTSELQSLTNLVCRLLLEKKKQKT